MIYPPCLRQFDRVRTQLFVASRLPAPPDATDALQKMAEANRTLALGVLSYIDEQGGAERRAFVQTGQLNPALVSSPKSKRLSTTKESATRSSGSE